MKLGGLALVLAVALAAAFPASADDILGVSSQGPSGLTLDFRAQGAEQFTDGAGAWEGLDLPGFGLLLPGSLGVHVPVRTYLLGMPPGSEATCDIIDATYRDISDYDTQRIRMQLGDLFGEIPERPAEVTMTGYLRHQRVAGLRLAPLVYDRASGRLRVFESFGARVVFQGGESEASKSMVTGANSRGEDEAFYRHALLNYGQAGPWRRQQPLLRAAQGDYFSSSPNWIKIRIDTTGIYCLTGKDLEDAGISPGTIDAAGLRLYSGGGLPLVESLAEHNPDWMQMVAISVRDGGDGKIDGGDSIFFYGLGMHDWANLYDPRFGEEANYGSFFSDHNYYWLTWGGTFTEPPKRMDVVEAVGCDACPDCYQPESFRDRVHLEEDWRYDFNIRGDDGWYWRILNINNTASFTVPTPHPDESRNAAVKVRIGDSHTPSTCRYEEGKIYYSRVILRLNGTKIEDKIWRSSSTALSPVDVRGEGAVTPEDEQTVEIYLPGTLPDTYPDGLVCTNKPDLAWLEVYYWRHFVSDGRELFFRSPDSTCTVRYVIPGFDTESLRAFDITDQFGVREIVGFGTSPGDGYTVTLCDTVRAGDTRRYAVISSEAILKPAEITRAEIDNIRYAAGRPYCVVTHEDLAGAARVLAQYHDGEMVTVEEIYDEFGWGVPDVTAIRDFLRWRYETGDLEDVVIVGDATWDYKGYLTGETFTNYVPSYERRYRTGVNEPYNTDDWLVYLEPAGDGKPGSDSTAYFPTVPISRLPATSPEIADFLVGQAIDYMSNPELGPWQNRIILVADDDVTPKGCDEIDQGRHVEDMEAISDVAYPAVFDRVKIYLQEYPREPSGLKPAAKADLVKGLNAGALMTNYVGHGDPRRWAQEEVFNNPAVDLVAAGRKLSFLIASSCNVSKFDDPTFASVAERLLLRQDGGTIGSLASTHYCQADKNRLLHENFVRLLFADGRPYPTIPIGSATLGAKALVAAVSIAYRFNSEMYSMLGDAGLELAVPRLEVRFEPAGSDTLERRGQYDFSAQVYDDGQLAGDFAGDARAFVRESDDTSGYDSKICFVSPDVPKHFDYDLPGAEIYRSKTAVEDGRIDVGFLVSSAAREGDNGNIRCFVTDGVTSGAGILDSLVIKGETIVDDVEGPEVEIESGGTALAPGDTVQVGQAIDLVFFDQSGTAVKGKSESIPAVSVLLDGDERIDLSDSVYSVDGDFRKSRAFFEIPEMTGGVHTFGVTAFDNLNNSTTREYDFVVGRPGGEAANVVYAYPNPASGRCYIVWEYDNDLYIEVKAAIYTVAGRKIWTGSTAGRSSQHMIEWDGDDLAGDAVANGTYLAVVEATAPSKPGFKTKDTIVIALVR